MGSRLETELLAELIDRKYDLLQRMRASARQQQQFVDAGDTDSLLKLLWAKQTLFNQLQELEQQLNPYREQNPASRVWRSQADRKRTQSVADRCAALLKEIMLVERQCETELTQRRDAAANQLQGAHASATARRAYAQTVTPSTGALDLSSEG